MTPIQSKSMLVAVLGCFHFGTTVSIGPRVNTTIGVVEGFTKSVTSVTGNHSTEINVFLGIPYAEPPVGELRFSISRAKKWMEGVYNATEFGALCPQISSPEGIDASRDKFPPSAFVMDESCLFLNIYAPKVERGNDSSKAVMVWIHGGSYLEGTGNILDGSFMAAYGDVVVVTINYRLGALGYLATGEKYFPANFGATDQQNALLWVSNNAWRFGGDPFKVTLFGSSAGAASLCLLTLNYPANMLFHRVIAQGGTALSSYAMVDTPVANMVSTDIGVRVNCSAQIPDFVSCLRKLSWEQLLNAQKEYLSAKTMASGFFFGPIVDGSFFFFSPADVVTGRAGSSYTERFGAIDHLIGVNSQEGAFIYDTEMELFRSKFGVNDTVDGMPGWVFDSLMNRTANQISRDHSETLKAVLKYRYTDQSNLEDGFETAIQYINAQSDNVFFSSIIPWTQFHALLANNTGEVAGSTYFYYFDHRGSWQPSRRWRTGADHGDDVPFVFGYPFIDSRSSDAEKALSLAMIAFWTNFAKTGNPNYPDPPLYPVTWPPYVMSEEKYIRLSTDSEPRSLLGRKLAADRVAFWTNFLPNLLSTSTTPKPCPVVTTPAPLTGSASGVVRSTRTVLFITFLFTILARLVSNNLTYIGISMEK